jgi:hypothetical protein
MAWCSAKKSTGTTLSRQQQCNKETAAQDKTGPNKISLLLPHFSDLTLNA